jgi:hypothetical protein
MASSSIFVIPLTGVYELILDRDDPRAVLEERDTGTYVAMNFEVDSNPGGVVHFLVREDAYENHRARRALADLCGAHVILTGDVAFTGLDAVTVTSLVHDQ